jgi:two-component system chemotaxis response regulator CheB
MTPPPTPRIVVMGTSAGGLRALEQILQALPPTFRLPIVCVQHRSRESTDAFARVLSSSSALPVREVDDGMPLEPSVVFVAPPDYHLLVEPGSLSLSTEEPVSFSRPSIDVLFETATDVFGDGVIAVLLTGANSDGARGLVRVKAAGGVAIVQDPRTAESPDMPRAAIAATSVDRIMQLADIPGEIVRRVGVA